MQIKHKPAVIIAVIGSFYSLFATYIIFINHWQEAYWAKAAQYRADESVIIEWIYPALHDIAMIGSVILLVSAFLHRREHKWAWNVSMMGILLMVLGTVFPIVGSGSAGIFPMYIFVAIPNLAVFYLFLCYVRKADGTIVALATIVGITYTVCLLNGIASASRAIQHGGVEGIHIFAGMEGYPDEGSSAKFVASMRLNWFASALWISFMMTMLLKKAKHYLVMISTAAVVLSLFGGVL
ncbi:MAG: hypothetical protein PHE15_01970, partial [Dehalococcoidales bacterium]|nr:hypothetical protein [Dehalococcoidales bacterium]